MAKERQVNDKQAYPIPEFCSRYSVSRSTFYREVDANRLQILKVGRRTLVAKSDADAWLASLRSPTSPTT